MATLVPWQQRNKFITLLFEGKQTSYWTSYFIWTSYLVHIYVEAVAVNGITCCHRNLATMATQACAYKFCCLNLYELLICYTDPLRPLQSIVWLFAIKPCYQSNQGSSYNFAVWRYMNSLFGTQIPWGNINSWYDLLLWNFVAVATAICL